MTRSVKTLSGDGNSQSSNVLTTTGDEVALSLVPTDVYADMVTDISPYFLNPETNVGIFIISIFANIYVKDTATTKFECCMCAPVNVNPQTSKNLR